MKKRPHQKDANRLEYVTDLTQRDTSYRHEIQQPNDPPRAPHRNVTRNFQRGGESYEQVRNVKRPHRKNIVCVYVCTLLFWNIICVLMHIFLIRVTDLFVS